MQIEYKNRKTFDQIITGGGGFTQIAGKAKINDFLII